MSSAPTLAQSIFEQTNSGHYVQAAKQVPNYAVFIRLAASDAMPNGLFGTSMDTFSTAIAVGSPGGSAVYVRDTNSNGQYVDDEADRTEQRDAWASRGYFWFCHGCWGSER
eukprot:TRINITY_DN752_c0_g1_i1.p1 TRINITY_DN752_c0_g1~~TRINITY_DN752_c0_g1_i1.p1  ORF type:complete len:111 (+),score=15.81 TRINITY_DN752_c0_g1_i1:533-865(+)